MSLSLSPSLPPLLPCKDTKRWLIMNQGESPYKKPNELASWSLTSRPPWLWEISFCCLSHLVHGILLWQPEMTKTTYKVAINIYIYKCLCRYMLAFLLGKYSGMQWLDHMCMFNIFRYCQTVFLELLFYIFIQYMSSISFIPSLIVV